jgi:DNA-binding Lrp family transcriptional regulator
MILTREEKERLVIDLYNRRTPIRVIAKEAGMSFRDIGAIKKKAEEEKEASKEQAEKMSQSAQAYKLFSEGKSPVQVAIALNIREPEVARVYVEYWKLVQHHSLSRIYEEIKDDDIGYFVNLYRSAKAAGMGIPHVINPLSIANNDLPSVEYRYEQLQRQK